MKKAAIGRPEALRYMLSGAMCAIGSIAVLSAQRADVKPPVTITEQSYPAAQVESGRTVFAARCGFCHGRDTAGGESGPDLTRSALVAQDVRGDKIGAVVRAGRPDRGMPAFTLADADIAALVAFVHDQKTRAESQEGGRRSVDPADLQTGNAAAGQRYFEGAGGCTKCHSATGDLADVATRLQGLTLLQRMLYPAPRQGRPLRARAAVTLPSGEVVAGTLASRDEFAIAVIDTSGRYRSWPAGSVKAIVDNPLDAHSKQLDVYTDNQIHDVLAYLQSLRGSAQGDATAAPAPVARGKGFDPALLLSPPSDSWPTYHGDYSGRRHSGLTQLSPANVRQLTLSWAFETGQSAQIKATPILANGVMYLAMPDAAWAVDARTGRQIWRYTYPSNEGFHIGHRGVAIRGNSVFLTTPDAHLLSLDANTGAVNWNVAIADSKRGYWSTMAPLVVRDHLLVGVSGDFDNLPGVLKSIDPETGKTQWTFYSTPPAGAPDSKSGGATGGQMWMTGTYDPDLNLVFVGTGNPTPTLNGPARPGDNPWTCSILAINPDSGQLAWGFQASPHDTHDWDAAEVPVLVDAVFNGAPRKLLLQASRNGYFFVLDRTNGKSLLTKPFSTVNWASGVDKDGRPTPAASKEPARDGRLVAPNESGATNFRSPSFDPRTGLLVVSAQDGYGIYFFKPEHGAFGWAGADYTLYGKSTIRAIDYRTGAIKWNHDIGDGAGTAGVLTTESGLTFTGDIAGNVLALKTSDGATLWHASIGRVGNSPITYELDGRQYLVVAGGGALYAWTLPPK
jgi:alcohol dehydrogenase (cytochrome c)